MNSDILRNLWVVETYCWEGKPTRTDEQRLRKKERKKRSAMALEERVQEDSVAQVPRDDEEEEVVAEEKDVGYDSSSSSEASSGGSAIGGGGGGAGRSMQLGDLVQEARLAKRLGRDHDVRTFLRLFFARRVERAKLTEDEQVEEELEELSWPELCRLLLFGFQKGLKKRKDQIEELWAAGKQKKHAVIGYEASEAFSGKEELTRLVNRLKSLGEEMVALMDDFLLERQPETVATPRGPKRPELDLEIRIELLQAKANFLKQLGEGQLLLLRLRRRQHRQRKLREQHELRIRVQARQHRKKLLEEGEETPESQSQSVADGEEEDGQKKRRRTQSRNSNEREDETRHSFQAAHRVFQQSLELVEKESLPLSSLRLSLTLTYLTFCQDLEKASRGLILGLDEEGFAALNRNLKAARLAKLTRDRDQLKEKEEEHLASSSPVSNRPSSSPSVPKRRRSPKRSCVEDSLLELIETLLRERDSSRSRHQLRASSSSSSCRHQASKSRHQPQFYHMSHKSNDPVETELSILCRSVSAPHINSS